MSGIPYIVIVFLFGSLLGVSVIPIMVISERVVLTFLERKSFLFIVSAMCVWGGMLIVVAYLLNKLHVAIFDVSMKGRNHLFFVGGFIIGLYIGRLATALIPSKHLDDDLL